MMHFCHEYLFFILANSADLDFATFQTGSSLFVKVPFCKYPECKGLYLP